MNIEEDINILKQLIREYKRKPETQNEFFIGLIEERALENLLTAYEEEKEKNKEITIKNNSIKNESNAYGEEIVRLDNQLKAKNQEIEYLNCIIESDKDNYINKNKIKPIQIIDLDGKIHNVYRIEEE